MLSNRELRQVRRETVWGAVFTARFARLMNEAPPFRPHLDDVDKIADRCAIDAAAYANDVVRRLDAMEKRE